MVHLVCTTIVCVFMRNAHAQSSAEKLSRGAQCCSTAQVWWAKHKFGGPFTEEEVEDVKTIFCFLPLLLVALVPGLQYNELSDQFGLHAILTTTTTFECVKNLKRKFYYVTSFILIPVYRFIVYPLVCLMWFVVIVAG